MSSTVLFSERRNVSRKHTFLNLIGNGLSNVMTMVNNEVGIGTTVPRSALYIEGDVILKGRFMDSNLNPMMGVLPAWLPMAVAPSFTLPGTGGAVTYSKQQGSFRFAGNEILYNVNIECTVDSQPTGGEAAGDFKLTLPDPVSATSYMAATIVGDLWLSVTLNGGGGEVTNTFKALAKTSTTDATTLTVRYLSGTTEGSLAYMTAGAVIQVQGTMIYTSAREMAALSLPATANRSYQVLQNQALSLLGSTFTWRETQLPPTFVVTAPGVVSYPNVRKGLFKYLGTDVAFNVNVKARIETAPPLASDYKLTLPYPVKLASYAAPTVIGDLLLSVYNGTSSNAFKAYAETMPSDSNSALIRYISGTTEDSLATITQGITFELAGTMTYDTTVMYNGDIYTAYIPPVFSQDTDGNVVMNGSGYLPRGRLDVIDSSTSPVMVVDQKGAGDLVQLKKNGVTQVRVDASGNVGIGTTQPLQPLHVQGTVQATTFSGSGALLTALNAGNISTGTLAVAQGGTGAGTLTASKVLVGNGTSAVLQPAKLHWDNMNSRLGIGTTNPLQNLHMMGKVRIDNELVFMTSISGQNPNRTYLVGSITVNAQSSGFSGDYHSCAVNNGLVYTWGYNWATSSYIPVSITSGSLSGRTVVAVAGGFHTLALDSTGAVHAWGRNIEGQLGNNSTTDSGNPIDVSTFGSLSGRTVVAITCHRNHSLALDSTGAVHAWGKNNQGQFGNNSTTNSLIPINVSSFGSLSGRTVVAVTACVNHTLAVDSTGAVHAWGVNDAGQLGNNSTTNSLIPINVSSFGSLSGRTVRTVAGGEYHSVALDSTGAVHTWGSGNFGRLGDGSGGGTSSLIPKNVSSSGSLSGRTVVAVSSGMTHTAALDSTGAVHTWGFGNQGEVGNGGTDIVSTPVNVSSFGSLSGRTVVAVACGTDNTLALDSTGAMHAWGYNGFGQLGNGTTTDALIPIYVGNTAAVGIGLTPTFQLHLSTDSAAKPSTSTWTVTSDKRLKTDVAVADYDRCYEIVSKLDLKSYNWDSNIPQLMQSVGSDQHRLGWIAQEVELVFPKAIYAVPELYGLSNVLNANFDQIYATMYGTIKKLMANTTQLMANTTQLMAKVEEQGARIKAIEDITQ
jgi:alpha-tubulin suppressor-like RCC1 family protein